MSEYSYKGLNGEPSRRFISAARCPSCHREDTLYFVGEIGGDHACIECGYDSSRPAATHAEAVKIMDAPSKSSKSSKSSKQPKPSKQQGNTSTNANTNTNANANTNANTNGDSTQQDGALEYLGEDV